MDSNKLFEIKQTLEKCVDETQADLKLFKYEHNQLRTEIVNIIAENHRLNTKLETENNTSQSVVCNSGESKDDATRERLQSDTLKNIKRQINYLQTENSELRSLNQSFQRTIQNLENEVQNYRQHLLGPSTTVEIKHKYATAIKLLESTIKSQNAEIVQQTQVIESAIVQRKELRKHIENLEAALSEKERELNLCFDNRKNSRNSADELQKRLFEVMQQNHDLEKSLKLSKSVVDDRFEREKCALQKVQEALTIAETAVRDKEKAQQREQIVKEECENLASTIGEVMDEAARKVEIDMESMRVKFNEKEQSLMKAHEKITSDLQNQCKYNQILDTRCNRFEQKFNETTKENEKLRNDLQAAKISLEELNLKVLANEKLIAEYKDAKGRAEEQEQEIQKYMQTNKQLKEKYKATIDDVTKRFEKEIHRLQSENATLKAENQVMKVKTCVITDCDDDSS